LSPQLPSDNGIAKQSGRNHSVDECIFNMGPLARIFPIDRRTVPESKAGRQKNDRRRSVRHARIVYSHGLCSSCASSSASVSGGP
jgi:hypothetical protein